MDSYFGFLAESGKVFSAPMETREALSLIARKAVPRLGDLCAVHLLDGYRNTEVSLVAWAGPASDSTQALQERFFAGPEADALAAGLLADLEMASSLTYPLKARGGLQGYLTLGTLCPGGYSPDQEFLVEEFSRNIAFGLESQVLPEGIPALEAVPLPKSGAELREVEQELQSNRDLLRLVTEGAEDSIMILDSRGRCVLANDAALKSFGFASPEEAAMRPLEAILAHWRLLDSEGRTLGPEDLPHGRALSGQGVSEKLVHAIHRKTGAERWWEIRAVPKPGEGKGIMAVVHVHDATRIQSLQSSLKQERQAVRAIRNLLQSTMDALPDSLAVLDAEGRILYANKGMSDFLGTETLQRGFSDPIQEVPDHLEFRDERGDALAWDQLPLWAALRGEHAVDRVLRYRDGRKEIEGWTRMRAVPILDLRGRLVMVAALFHDLTSHKQDQNNRESVEARLRQAHKMDAISRLAGGIAHDFNNLLTSIIGYADLIADSAPEHPRIPAYAGEIRISANRAAHLTAQLLAFGRRQMLHPRLVDLNARLSSQLPMLQELAGPRVALDFHPAADLPMVRVDPIKWDQAVLNLVINSAEAMPQGGHLGFATTLWTLDQALEVEDAAIPPGTYALVEVADTGRGMDAETQALIFEPFFSAGQDGIKTGGLGLPMVLGFIRQSGGFIQLQSAPDQGTRFRIFLPAWDGENPHEAGNAGAPSGTGHGPGA